MSMKDVRSGGLSSADIVRIRFKKRERPHFSVQKASDFKKFV